DIAFQYAENVSVKELQKILTVIQDFDPPGIAACNLQECLMIQLKKRKPSKEIAFAKKILSEYFDKFTKRHFERIRKDLKISEEQMKTIIHEITSLNPKPGSSWDDAVSAMKNRITPDFIVETHNGMISLTLNNRGVPDLRINREYVDWLKDYTGNKANQNADMRDAVLFVKQKIDSAQGFIEAIKQRQNTLRHTMETIINMQQDFFLTGDESRLRPMILKDVAERTGLDIATISRVSNSKYVQTNFGVYPLKFFFSESAQTQSGEVISTRKIKQIIEHEVAGENKQKPLTDDELTAMLKAKGFMTARRTVAKYREQLEIPIARLRREM
ncbi:MAG: RNA polymerase factor sigma-54, partial [Tannerella sp.]|nr:RNA polymerase factor sigma-54 [Tannerella sp.]